MQYSGRLRWLLGTCLGNAVSTTYLNMASAGCALTLTVFGWFSIGTPKQEVQLTKQLPVQLALRYLDTRLALQLLQQLVISLYECIFQFTNVFRSQPMTGEIEVAFSTRS